jgi:hypothetical protein
LIRNIAKLANLLSLFFTLVLLRLLSLRIATTFIFKRFSKRISYCYNFIVFFLNLFFNILRCIYIFFVINWLEIPSMLWSISIFGNQFGHVYIKVSFNNGFLFWNFCILLSSYFCLSLLNLILITYIGWLNTF